MPGRTPAAGRYVVYPYVISALLVSFKRYSDPIYIAPGESALLKGLPYVLASLLLGWWGFPWGVFWTPVAIGQCLHGGIDVSR